MNRRAALAIAAVAAVAALAGLLYLTPLGQRLGVGSLRDFLARQISGIVDSYLVPDFAFDSIDYESPRTVHLSGVRMTGADGTEAIDVSRMTIALARVPRVGEPISIERITIDGGRINIVIDPETGDIRGLLPLVRPGEEIADDEVPEEFRITNVLDLRRIEIRNIDVTYDPGGGEPPMVIEGFEVAMDIEPVGDEPGWYALAFTSGRRPGLEIDLDGRFNIDTLDVSIAEATFDIEIDDETAGTLPPEIRTLLQEYDAKGIARVSLSGDIPLQNPFDANVRARLDIETFNVAAGDYRLPIERGGADIVVADGLADLDELVLEMLDGRINVKATAELTATDRPARATWQIDNLDLRELLRAGAEEGAEPRLAGRLTGHGEARTALEDPMAGIGGVGFIRLREGRLVAIPILSELASVLQVGGLGSGLDHRADVEFNLTPEGVDVTSCEVVTPALAARATGLIGFDGELNMRVNAGPLERVQSLLGGIGDVLGGITDRLVTYRVRGTVAEPRISVQPLGIGD